ncbi:MAG: hypothetical protein ABSF03_31230, partial [Streptosporangiaceae bacterium]
MTPAAAAASDCLTALAALLMIIFAVWLMIVTPRRDPSRAVRGAARDAAAAGGALASGGRAGVVAEAAAVPIVKSAGPARRAGALWLSGSAGAARLAGQRRAGPGTVRRAGSGRARRGGPAAGRGPWRSLVLALTALIAVSAVAVQFAAPAADAQVVSHQAGPQPAQPAQPGQPGQPGQHSQSQPRARSGRATGGPPAAAPRPVDVSSPGSVNQLITDQQRLLDGERAAADPARAAWEQAANAAAFVAELHQYITGLWQQAHRDLTKLRAASDAGTRGQLADSVRQAITTVTALRQLEAAAPGQPLPGQAQRSVDEITPGLPAGVGTAIRNAVAVREWLTAERLEQIGVWETSSAPGQPALVGDNP